MSTITGRSTRNSRDHSHGPEGNGGPGMPDPGQTTTSVTIPEHTILGSRYRQAQAATAEYDETRRTNERISAYDKRVKESKEKIQIGSSNRVKYYKKVMNSDPEKIMHKARINATTAAEKINAQYTPKTLTASYVDQVIKDASSAPIQTTGSAASLMATKVLIEEPATEKKVGSVTGILIAAAVVFIMMRG